MSPFGIKRKWIDVRYFADVGAMQPATNTSHARFRRSDETLIAPSGHNPPGSVDKLFVHFKRLQVKIEATS
jgi:hypothetical protein